MSIIFIVAFAGCATAGFGNLWLDDRFGFGYVSRRTRRTTIAQLTQNADRDSWIDEPGNVIYHHAHWSAISHLCGRMGIYRIRLRPAGEDRFRLPLGDRD